MADRWVALNEPERWTTPALTALEASIHAWPITPSGTEGYAKAEVTVGGVNTNQLDARTMESKLVPGLFFIGEVVDVTGWLGGYNFQWALGLRRKRRAIGLTRAQGPAFSAQKHSWRDRPRRLSPERWPLNAALTAPPTSHSPSA